MKKNSLVSVVRYFRLMVAKYSSVVTVFSKEKQRSERSHIFRFNSSEVKQGSDCSH